MSYKELQSVYYIGFSPINGICNEDFFKGSITVYPNYEIGNIFYSCELVDMNTVNFIDDYKKFVYTSAKSIQKADPNAVFICFNDNKRTKMLCENMKDINIILGNSNDVLDKLNNKFVMRTELKGLVPMLDYIYLRGNDLNYDELCKKIKCNSFVVQEKTGAGGNGTSIVRNNQDLKRLKNEIYSISGYVKNTPLNITIVIGVNDILLLPISVQLITQLNHGFCYVGGDFIASQRLSSKIVSKINKYSLAIGKHVKNMGYRGILGIDYLLCNDGKLVFMEINPRYQASSFLISKALQSSDNTNLSELHHLAISGNHLERPLLNKIDYSFLNCKKEKREFENDSMFSNFEIVKNGFFELDSNSIYRKLYKYSIYGCSAFEKGRDINC